MTAPVRSHSPIKGKSYGESAMSDLSKVFEGYDIFGF